MKPLAGVRVLDLTNVLAGPFCCHQLAHMGADVVKVEVPGSGDLARQLGADPDLNRALMGVSFLAQNSGKRSVTVNLKHAKGKAVFRRLVRGADVVVENFRPGVMDRLGLGYEILKEENPGLIYCAISGFGQDGPLRDLPAYDQIVQGMSGVMAITGDADTAPLRVGYPVADTIGGMTAAFAVASALANRGGDGQGGCFIDVSMLESVIATMGWVVSNYLVAGKAPVPMGNANFTASPSGTFRTGDGPINIAANKQEQFEAVCRVIGRPELIDDPRFAQRQARLDNRAALTAVLEEALAARGAAEWRRELNAAGVPAGRVLTVPEALAHPQIADRGLIGTFTDVPGVGRDVRLARPGFKLDGAAPETDRPPPELGAHTDEILAEAGFTPGEIEDLKAEGAL
ncbi:MAG: CoA transferase [Rhodobacterales bacterium]|nr:CoA transferase [Rhodobacterales bacterium]